MPPREKSDGERRRDKERAKRRHAAEKLVIEREHREAGNPGDERAAELRAVKEVLKAEQLFMVDIPADGHCLYRAVLDQVSFHRAPTLNSALLKIVEAFPSPTPHEALRKSVGDHLQKHAPEYSPYVPVPEGIDAESSGGAFFRAYCVSVAEDPMQWGTLLEVRALSELLGVHVRVISASTVTTFGDEKGPLRLSLVYLEKLYTLGGHFNSARMRS